MLVPPSLWQGDLVGRPRHRRHSGLLPTRHSRRLGAESRGGMSSQMTRCSWKLASHHSKEVVFTPDRGFSYSVNAAPWSQDYQG